jgi:phosphoserine phosphatase
MSPIKRYDSAGKMIVLDINEMILDGNFLTVCAEHFGFSKELKLLNATEHDKIISSKYIGKLLKGKSAEDLLLVADTMPIVDDIKNVIIRLKEKNYIVGIISYNYSLITEHLKQKIGADFSLEYNLELVDGIANGVVDIPYYFFGTRESICGHSFCKTNALEYACEVNNIPIRNCMVICCNKDDHCLSAHAGTSISFCSDDETLKKAAQIHITGKSFQPLLSVA